MGSISIKDSEVVISKIDSEEEDLDDRLEVFFLVLSGGVGRRWMLILGIWTFCFDLGRGFSVDGGGGSLGVREAGNLGGGEVGFRG